MRWSIQELFMAISWKWSGWWWRKLITSPHNIYRSMKTIMFWIFTGYTKESLWNLDNWFDKVILFRLQKFAAYDRMGYPGHDEADTVEDWQKILDTMTEGFEEIVNETYAEEHRKFADDKIAEGLKFDEWNTPKEVFEREQELYKKSQEKKDLFWKWYGHLWD